MHFRIVSLLASTLLLAFGTAQPLRANFIISEFMSANSSGIADEDGENSDWIEIHNGGKSTNSLAGWKLTDDARRLTVWTFPDLPVPPGGFKVIFASGKNRTDARTNLHTNFRLNRDGGYLALLRPDNSLASVFSAYPRQLSDVSYGFAMSRELESLVSSNHSGKILVPSDDSLRQSWYLQGFDDSFWRPAMNGLGYDNLPVGEGDPFEPATAFEDVTKPGDPVLATSSNSPGNEGVGNAIDNNTATKYLNFDKLNAGLTVSPVKGSSVITGLRLTSANDAPERDPTSYVLFGSNDGKEFFEISRGTIPNFSGRFVSVEVSFTNTIAWLQYRLLFPTVINAASAVAMQIAEIEFLGKTGAGAVPLSGFIRTDLKNELFEKGRVSLYSRFTFSVETNRSWDDLDLLVRYDDGFAAWLNGVLVAGANSPATRSYNGLAPTNHFRRDAAQPVRFDLNQFSSLLTAGANVLAVGGWNDRTNSPDFLLEATFQNSRQILGAAGYFDESSPGAENSITKAGLVSTPTNSVGHGLFEQPFDLTIHTATEGATIRFTTNGSLPDIATGITYAGPIRIDKTTVLRAVAIKEGWRSSQPSTASYIFLGDVVRQNQGIALAAGFPQAWNSQPADYGLDKRIVGPGDSYGGKYARSITNDLRALPTMSIVMSMEDLFGAQGIYSNPLNHGEGWERPGSIELLYPDKSPGFQADAGFRIQGGAFRRFDLTLKKSFRVIFRGKYGVGTLKYPLFGPGSASGLNNFVLRANSNDAWPYAGGNAVYVRDSFAMESARAMGIVSSHSTFVHLYINGFYWGLYNPAERPDAAFSASYYGGEKENWDAINQDSAPDGNYLAWNRMMNQLNQDFTSTDVYQRIQGNNPDGTRNPAYEDLLDVDNLIDYMILNIYIGNGDWPGRNWWSSRDRNNGDGFKFHPWDSETALGLTDINANVTGVDGAVARPYAVLRANADFRLRFADHVYRHFFHGGTFYVNSTAPAWNPALPENNQPARRFFALSEQIGRGIVGETARWGDQLRVSPFTRDENWLTARNSLLANYLPRRSGIVLQQLKSAGLYPTIDPPQMNVSGGSVTPGFQLLLTGAGTIYYTTNGTDPRVVATAIRYTGPIPINDQTQVKTRALSGAQWSALNEASFVHGSPSLVITELHYHPGDISAAERSTGFLDEDDFEFIEFMNNGTGSYELSQVKFVTGIQFDFAQSRIQRLKGGEILLLVKNRAAFEFRYGTGLPVAGEYTGKLDNSGERIQATKGSASIFDFTYGTTTPWPTVPDGDGQSLEPIKPSGDLSSGLNWRQSLEIGGSPGRMNPVPKVQLQLVRVDSDIVRLGFGGRKGVAYILQVSENLEADSWQTAQGITPPTSDQRIELAIPVNDSDQERFFRIIEN